MGLKGQDYSMLVNFDRAVENAYQLVELAQAHQGVFAEPVENLRPQLPLPPSIADGTMRAARYRFLGGGVDLRDKSTRLWRRHYNFFSEHEIDDVPSWSVEQEQRYLATVAPHTHHSFIRYEKEGLLPAWMHWFDTKLDMNQDASVNRESLRSLFWLRKHLSGIMIQYVYETFGKPLDAEFVPKVDLHDVNFAFATGEIHSESHRINRSKLEFIVADVMKRAPVVAGVDKGLYKNSRWCLMEREFGTRINVANAKRRIDIVLGLHETYPLLFLPNVPSWVAQKRHSFYVLRHVTHAPSLFARPQ